MLNKIFRRKIIVYTFICISIFIIGYVAGQFSNTNLKWVNVFYEKIKNEFGTINRNEEYVIGDIPLNYPRHIYIIIENDIKTIRVGSIFD